MKNKSYSIKKVMRKHRAMMKYLKVQIKSKEAIKKLINEIPEIFN